MARYLEDRLDEEAREECYWCQKMFEESKLEEIEGELICESCREEYLLSISDED